MSMPTEPIGSIPRPIELIRRIKQFQEGRIPKQNLDRSYSEALKDTIRRFEETGSPVV